MTNNNVSKVQADVFVGGQRVRGEKPLDVTEVGLRLRQMMQDVAGEHFAQGTVIVEFGLTNDPQKMTLNVVARDTTAPILTDDSDN